MEIILSVCPSDGLARKIHAVLILGLQETHHEMRIPESDVTYIVLTFNLLTLIHKYRLNRK